MLILLRILLSQVYCKSYLILRIYLYFWWFWLRLTVYTRSRKSVNMSIRDKAQSKPGKFRGIIATEGNVREKFSSLWMFSAFLSYSHTCDIHFLVWKYIVWHRLWRCYSLLFLDCKNKDAQTHQREDWFINGSNLLLTNAWAYLNGCSRSLEVSDLRSETKGSRFESGCKLCIEVSSRQ